MDIEEVKEAEIINHESEDIQDTCSEISDSTKVKNANNYDKDSKALTIKYPSKIDEIKDIKKKTSSTITKTNKKVKKNKKLSVKFDKNVKVRQHTTKWGKKYRDWFSNIKDNQNEVKVNFLLASVIPHDISLREMSLTRDRRDFILDT